MSLKRAPVGKGARGRVGGWARESSIASKPALSSAALPEPEESGELMDRVRKRRSCASPELQSYWGEVPASSSRSRTVLMKTSVENGFSRNGTVGFDPPR